MDRPVSSELDTSSKSKFEGIRGRMAHSPRYPWLVLATALFGLFTVGFTITILAISVPRMAEEFNSVEATITWVVTGPMLAFAVVGPATGKLADIYGQRRMYLIGLGGAGIFAAFTAMAWDPASLISFRILSATMGAACGPASMAMINKLFTREQRVQAMGYWSLVMAGGPVIGAVAGGPVVEAFGWRWIFIAQVPVVLIGFLVSFVLLPEGDTVERVRFDFAGSMLLGSSSAAALLALNRGPIMGWSHPLVVAGFVYLPVGLVLFFSRQRRIDYPLVPLEYLRRRNFTFPIVTQMLTNFAYMGGFMLTPLLLQDVLAYGEARTSVVSIARPLLFAIAGPVAGAVAIRVGERSSAVFGVIIIVLSMVGLAQVSPGISDIYIMAALGLSGIGMGAVSPSMAASIANAVDERDLGVAGATQQMMSQTAAVVGIQLLQTVQSSRVDSVGLVSSYSHAYLFGGFISALAIFSALMIQSTKDARAIDTEALALKPIAAPVGR